MIVVIDGLGGKIGCEIIARLRQKLGSKIEITALATNAVAAAKMLQSGANKVASGENAFRINLEKAKLIIAPISISIPNSMTGELTPKMANIVSMSPAKKIFLPINPENSTIIGVKKEPLPHLMEELIEVVESGK